MSSTKVELRLKTEVDLTKDQVLELLKEAESVYSYAAHMYRKTYSKCVEDKLSKCTDAALFTVWDYIYNNMSQLALSMCNDADVGVNVNINNDKLHIVTIMCKARVKVSGTVPLS